MEGILGVVFFSLALSLALLFCGGLRIIGGRPFLVDPIFLEFYVQTRKLQLDRKQGVLELRGFFFALALAILAINISGVPQVL